jgi:hypothetical protein
LYFFEPREEAAHAGPGPAVAVDDEPPLLGREVAPRHVERHADRLRHLLQIGEVRTVVRLGPRLDGALGDRLGLVGHHEIDVEFDDVAEAVAGRAGAERVVEREQARLRRLVRQGARPALEALAEDVPHVGRPVVAELHGPGRPAALLIGDLDRIGEPGPLVGTRAQPIDDHRQRGAPVEIRGRQVFEGHGPAVHEQAAEALPAQRLDGGPSGRGRPGFGDRLDRTLVAGVGRVIGLLVGRGMRGQRGGEDRHVEADEQPRAVGQSQEAVGHDLRGLADHLDAAGGAERAAHAREEQAHVVVHLGDGAHGGARIAHAVLLADGNRRRDALDPVDVGLLHPLEELPRVGRQGLHVAALPFGVDGVEGERRLARAADPGEHHQLAGRQCDVDVLQVVGTCPTDDEGVGSPGG